MQRACGVMGGRRILSQTPTRGPRVDASATTVTHTCKKYRTRMRQRVAGARQSGARGVDGHRRVVGHLVPVDEPDAAAVLAEERALQLAEVDEALGGEEDGELVHVELELDVNDADPEAEALGRLLDRRRRALLLHREIVHERRLRGVGAAHDAGRDVVLGLRRRDRLHNADVLATVGLHDDHVARRDAERRAVHRGVVLEANEGVVGLLGVLRGGRGRGRDLLRGRGLGDGGRRAGGGEGHDGLRGEEGRRGGRGRGRGNGSGGGGAGGLAAEHGRHRVDEGARAGAVGVVAVARAGDAHLAGLGGAHRAHGEGRGVHHEGVGEHAACGGGRNCGCAWER
mmetsp:Transcript_34113/g.105428  ORF Transcript_34113/g.105428 Transcript_34113/m.105428 type:complete len:341 (-) Transcript_34113:88-1110(-)